MDSPVLDAAGADGRLFFLMGLAQTELSHAPPKYNAAAVPGGRTVMRYAAGASCAASNLTEPPAASIAATADFEAAATSKASFAFSSP